MPETLAPSFAEIEPRSVDDPEAVIEAIRDFEQSINERPAVFQAAMRVLGEAATAETFSVEAILQNTAGEEGIVLDDETQEAVQLIHTYFSKYHDRAVTFDEATEDALMKDSTHSALVQTHRNTKPVRVATGTMNHTTLPNKAATPSSNAVRRSRLSFYIARVVAWQVEHPAEPQAQASY